MGETIKVGVANDKEKSISIQELKEWKPTKINYFRDVVYFKHDGVYYNMMLTDFKKIYNL